MDKQTPSKIGLDSDACIKIIRAIRLIVRKKQAVVSYEEVLKRYLYLSVKSELSESNSEELDLILEKACQDKKLMALTQLIDQHIDLASNALDKNMLAEVELGRVKSLDRLLGTSFNADKSAAIAGRKNGLHIRHISCHRVLSYCLSPLSVAATGLVISFLCFKASPVFSKYIEKVFDIGSNQQNTSGSVKNNNIKINNFTNFPSSLPKGFCNRDEVRWVAPRFDGHRTAYGAVYRNSEYTAAHAFLPPGSKIHIQSESSTNPVKVEVNDRSQTLAVSYKAAHKLGVIEKGIALVTLTQVEISQDDLDKLDASQLKQLNHFKKNCKSLILDASDSQ